MKDTKEEREKNYEGRFLIMQHILIADDNHDITDILSTYSRMEGFEPVVAGDGEEAIRLFTQYNPDVVLLDVMMPKEDGYEVCRKIRSKSNVPVILITARGEDFDKIMGLDIGADDYIVKPFSPREVMARVRAVMRRMTKTAKEASPENVLTVGSLEDKKYTQQLLIEAIQLALEKAEIPE
jgi:DNA-binding response OmpR family regulator